MFYLWLIGSLIASLLSHSLAKQYPHLFFNPFYYLFILITWPIVVIIFISLILLMLFGVILLDIDKWKVRLDLDPPDSKE
jgi:hypothetical protein